MLFGPNQININNDQNSVYVIIEQDHSANIFKVLGVAHSLAVAQTFAKSNVIIKGPIPVLDPKPIQNNIFDYNSKPQFFEPDNVAKPKLDLFNIFEPPKFDLTKSMMPLNPFNQPLPKPEFHFGNTNNMPYVNMENSNVPHQGLFQDYGSVAPRQRRRYVTAKQSNNPFINNGDSMDLC